MRCSTWQESQSSTTFTNCAASWSAPLRRAFRKPTLVGLQWLRNRVVQPGGGALTIVASIQRAGQRLRRRGAPIATSGISRLVVGEASELTLILTGDRRGTAASSFCGATLTTSLRRRGGRTLSGVWRNDRGEWVDEAIRRQDCRRRPVVRGPARCGYWLPRPERRGQVHDDAADAGPRLRRRSDAVRRPPFREIRHPMREIGTVLEATA